MFSRRSFAKRLAAVVAAVALAPEIAFGSKLPLPVVQPRLNLDELFDLLYAIARQRRQRDDIYLALDEAYGTPWIRQLRQLE